MIETKSKKIEIKVDKLLSSQVTEFFAAFKTVLTSDFPGYSPKVINYFLTKVYNQASFSSWIYSGWKIILAAKEQGKIIGFAVLDKPYGGVCFCRWLGVLVEFRKKGVGRKLINGWINYAKSLGCHKVEIASQPEAKIFYQKCGLNLEGKRKLSYFGIDQYIFGKVLGKPKDKIMIKG